VYAGAGWLATAEVVGSRPLTPLNPYVVEETIKVTVSAKDGYVENLYPLVIPNITS